MKMALDTASGVNMVRAYEPGVVTIGETRFSRSLIVLPNALLSDWEPVDARELRPAHFDPLLAQQPELVILGTGETQVFPEPEMFAALMQAGIGFEVMANAAACRTYNIVLAEDRRAALALIFPQSGN